MLRGLHRVEKLDHFLRADRTTGRDCGFFGAGITSSKDQRFRSVTR